MKRREFIKTGLISAMGLIFVDCFWAEKFFIETNEYFLGKSNNEFSDIKLVQISDLHLQVINLQHRKLAQKLNDIKPDLIVFTGDSVDKDENVNQLNLFLKLIDHDIKKVAILGNWEYWGGINLENLKEIYSANNCILLINESIQFTFRNKTISITGVDDYIGGNADIELALNNQVKSDFNIILNHCPQYCDIITSLISNPKDFELILSGHTHGGQINLFGYIPFKPPGSGKYVKGWYKENSISVYVSKGIGTSVLPARIMARAEIAIFNFA